MDHFVQGVLTVSEETYIGEPDLRLTSGKTVRLLYADLRPRGGHEGVNPLSFLLEENQWYELLLFVMIGLARRTVTAAPILPPGTKMEIKSLALMPRYPESRYNWVVQGIVLDPHWDATSQPYLAVNGSLVSTHHFVLVQTAIGKMVLSYPDLEEWLGEQTHHLAPGAYLEWGPARLDMLAIIAKRDPQPGE